LLENYLLLIYFLNYRKSATLLSKESGIEVESENLNNFKNYIING